MNAPHSTGEQTPPEPQTGRSERPANGFFGWIRGLGLARSEDRWLTGVAAGIAAKIDIDPLIVRGIGQVGVIAVSGLPHLDDHQVIVETLTEWFGRKKR